MPMARIHASMDMDTSRFNRGVEGAEARITKMKASLGGIKSVLAGAFTIGAVAAIGRHVTEYASAISDIARQTQIGTDELQTFETAMINAGSTAEKARTGLVKLRDAQSEAIEGNATAVRAFERLGLTVQDVARMSMKELIQAVADGKAQTGDFGAIVDLFGTRNAAQMEEALDSLATNGFDNLTESMKDAGKILSEDVVDSLDRAEDAFQRFGTTMYRWIGNRLADLEDLGKSDVRLQREEMTRMVDKAQAAAAEKRRRLRKLEQSEIDAQFEDAMRETDRNLDAHIKKLKEIESVRDTVIRMQENLSMMKPNYDADQLRRIGSNILGNGTLINRDQEKIDLAKQSLAVQKDMLTTLREEEQAGIF